MSKIRQFLIFIAFVLSFSAFADAQAMTDYLFVEAVDSNQKPVPDAKVEAPSYNQKILQTDEKGKARMERLDLGNRTFSSEFTITKPDFYSFYDLGGLQNLRHRNIKVELLRIPKSKKERKALGDEQLKRDFFRAIQTGDIEAVRKLLKSGISANLSIGDLRGITGVDNFPAIFYPTIFGDGAMIKLLLKEGADVRKKDYFLSNILNYYLQSDLFAINNSKDEQEKAEFRVEYDEGLKALINAGVKVNSNNEGESPLIRAIETGKVNAVKILIANGADITAKAYAGKSILAFAKEYQSYNKNRVEYQEIIKLLETAGAK
jgi:hypothetical protein